MLKTRNFNEIEKYISQKGNYIKSTRGTEQYGYIIILSKSYSTVQIMLRCFCERILNKRMSVVQESNGIQTD